MVDTKLLVQPHLQFHCLFGDIGYFTVYGQCSLTPWPEKEREKNLVSTVSACA